MDLLYVLYVQYLDLLDSAPVPYVYTYVSFENHLDTVRMNVSVGSLWIRTVGYFIF